MTKTLVQLTWAKGPMEMIETNAGLVRWSDWLEREKTRLTYAARAQWVGLVVERCDGGTLALFGVPSRAQGSGHHRFAVLS